MIRGLDSFRFLAFLAVFLFHTGYLECGYLGVQAFFVLSGFLLTPILLDMKASLGRRQYFLNFYGRRCLRIFPLYYAGLAAAALVLLLAWQFPALRQTQGLASSLAELPWALTYTSDFYQAAHSGLKHTSPLFTHFWSLAVEEQFYLVWPFFLWLAPARRQSHWLWAIVLAGPALRAIILGLVSAGLAGGPAPRPDLVVYLLPFSHLDAFALGGLLALRREPLPLWAPWLAAALALGAGVASGLEWGIPNVTALGYPPFMSGAGQAVWGYSLFALAFGLALHALRRGALLPRLFALRSLQYLGRISYGLYVFHYPVMAAVNRACGHTAPGPVRHLLMLAVTVAVSAASYEWFEKRFLRLKDRWFPTLSQGVVP